MEVKGSTAIPGIKVKDGAIVSSDAVKDKGNEKVKDRAVLSPDAVKANGEGKVMDDAGLSTDLVGGMRKLEVKEDQDCSREDVQKLTDDGEKASQPRRKKSNGSKKHKVLAIRGLRKDLSKRTKRQGKSANEGSPQVPVPAPSLHDIMDELWERGLFRNGIAQFRITNYGLDCERFSSFWTHFKTNCLR